MQFIQSANQSVSQSVRQSVSQSVCWPTTATAAVVIPLMTVCYAARMSAVNYRIFVRLLQAGSEKEKPHSCRKDTSWHVLA